MKHHTQRVQDILKEHDLTTTIVEFAETTHTAQEAATAIGCEVAHIAKTLIFKGTNSNQPFCVIASGINRVDEKKLAALFGEPIEKPDAEYVREHTGFVIGGVAPIGHQFNTPPLIDQDLMQYESIWAAAGTPHTVFTITPADLVRITQGTVTTVKK